MRSASPSPLTSPALLTEPAEKVTGTITIEGVERGAIEAGEDPRATAIGIPLLSSSKSPDNQVGPSITVDISLPHSRKRRNWSNGTIAIEGVERGSHQGRRGPANYRY